MAKKSREVTKFDYQGILTPIMFNPNPDKLIFHAELMGERLYSGDVATLKKQIQAKIDGSSSVVWVPIIYIEARTGGNVRMGETYNFTGFNFERKWLAMPTPHRIIAAEWDVPEVKRLDFSVVYHSHYFSGCDWFSSLPATKTLSAFVVTYRVYDEAYWGFLVRLDRALRHVRDRIIDLVRPNQGSESLTLAGLQFLRTLPLSEEVEN